MEDLTLPSVGGSLKKWVHCAPIQQKKIQKKFKKFENSSRAIGQARGRRATIGRQPAARGSHFILLPPPFFLLPPLFFLLLPPLLGTLVNSTSLASAHACPAQTSP
jgi:hypothetical protein